MIVAPGSAVPDSVVALDAETVGATGAVPSIAAIAVAGPTLPAASVTVTEPVCPSAIGFAMLQFPLESAVVVARTVVPFAA